MSELIRVELGGKDSGVEPCLEGVARLIQRAVEELATDLDGEPESAQAAKDIADVTANWARAKLEAPVIDNELKLAQIAETFERLKLIQVQRRCAELEFQEKKLDVWEKRLTTALKWQSFLNTCVVRDANGGITLVLTNDNVHHLREELKAMAKESVEGFGL